MNKSKNIRITVFASCTILCMAAIFLFSSQNADDSSELSDSLLACLPLWIQRLILPITSQGMGHDIRKYAHMFEYFCLGSSSVLLFREINNYKGFFSMLISEAFCFLYACTDEFHQTFVPGRSGSFHDVLIDGIGFTVGICILTIIGVWIYTAKHKLEQ